MGVRIPNLDEIKARDPLLGEALETFADLHDNLGQKLSVNPQGKTLTPPPHVSLNITAANGITHFTVDNGSNPRTRQLHNWVDWADNPTFQNAQTEHLFAGTQRRVATMLGGPIYARSYTMYADGERQSTYTYASIEHDGLQPAITSVTGTGVTTTTATLAGPALPKSTGSGTASVSGQGFGVEKFVPQATTPGKPPKVFS
jgi:hypothetical protein